MVEDLRFAKMHGLGNDFVVLDGSSASRLGDLAGVARSLCRRRESIGSDGLLVVSRVGPGRVSVGFWNPDGSQAFCGNGSRCAALHAYRRGWVETSMVLETLQGEVPAEIVEGGVVLSLPLPTDRGEREWIIGETPLQPRIIDAGCPHVVLRQPAVDQFPLDQLGPSLRHHEDLGPDGANVSVFDDTRIRTWERGVEGETLACGSGAVACGYVRWLTDGVRRSDFRVLSGGTITIAMEPEGSEPRRVRMTGDAAYAFEGRLSQSSYGEL